MVEVLEARLPPRVHTITRKEKPLHPYAAMVIGSAGTSVECVATCNACDACMGQCHTSLKSHGTARCLRIWVRSSDGVAARQV